jgi:hypothetical protein
LVFLCLQTPDASSSFYNSQIGCHRPILSRSFKPDLSIYKEDFYLVEFTALRFTEAGAPLAAWRIRILPMNQHS